MTPRSKAGGAAEGGHELSAGLGGSGRGGEGRTGVRQVDHRVDTTVRQAVRLLGDVDVAIVEDVVGAEATQERLVVRAAGGQDGQARLLGELDGERADAARGSHDQDAAALTGPDGVEQRCRGERAGGQRGALRGGESGGSGGHGRGVVDDDVLGERTGGHAVPGDDGVAGGEAGDVLADGFDHSADVHAGDEGMPYGQHVSHGAGDEHFVDGVERGGLKPDQQLARAGGGSGYVRELEVLQRSVRPGDERLHDLAPDSCVISRGTWRRGRWERGG
ncbi:hypothetical protein ADK34_32785 [Streptomyces viridochromogenes]|uniref:Uncharacterized protein n=1 Tax=Streptomyces viridochromogenes TaxID=1938 RepID=A0A0L8JEP9_STRVR|nr:MULTISPECIES: hypothetical protein [Streptomyces]KOG12137.1 hypothetical protein ADK34_32785 [Streptomyces viridochromogenes]